MLYVSCAWRMDGATAPLSSGDLERDAAGMGRILETLVGRTVEAVDLNLSTLDLHLTLSGDVHAHIFCDGPAGYDNFSLFGPESIFTAKAYERVEVESREYE